MVVDQLLIRHVKNRWIRPDKSIHPESYRPRERPGTPTGFESNVSTSLKSCFPTIEDLESLKSKFDRTILYELNSNHPNARGYPCIENYECHVGITGDMARLANNDFQ